MMSNFSHKIFVLQNHVVIVLSLGATSASVKFSTGFKATDWWFVTTPSTAYASRVT